MCVECLQDTACTILTNGSLSFSENQHNLIYQFIHFPQLFLSNCPRYKGQGTFMCPPVVITLGAGSVNVEVLCIGVFEGCELVDLLSFGEWSQDIGDDGMGATHKVFQIAEPIQLRVPLGDFLAPHEQGGTFIKAGDKDFVVPLLWVFQMEGECSISDGVLVVHAGQKYAWGLILHLGYCGMNSPFPR